MSSNPKKEGIASCAVSNSDNINKNIANTNIATTSNTVVIQSKKNPELLFQELSTSLNGFHSIVETWNISDSYPKTTNESKNFTNNLNVDMRPARLGLGAKPPKNGTQTSLHGGVTTDLELKRKLTGITGGYKGNKSDDNNSKVTKSTFNNHKNNNNMNKQKKHQRKSFDDNEDLGRASLIGVKK